MKWWRIIVLKLHLYFGGCVTPTEIMKAAQRHRNHKVFPAETSGGEGIKAISAPFPQIRVYAHWRINKDNIRDYLSFPKIKLAAQLDGKR